MCAYVLEMMKVMMKVMMMMMMMKMMRRRKRRRWKIPEKDSGKVPAQS